MPRPRKTPEIHVVGLYSPVRSLAAYNRFVEQRIQERDPANYDQETLALFKRLGRKKRHPLTEDERLEIWEEYESNLAKAAVVEVIARNLDTRFDAGGFIQFDPGVREGWSQCAWQETYLTMDGKSLLPGYPSPELPDSKSVRLAFYIHLWRRRLGLQSTYGPLELPRSRPMPERLWRLMPYETPD